MLVLQTTRSAVGDPTMPRSAVAGFYDIIRVGSALTGASAFALGDWSLTNPVTDGDLLVSISTLPQTDSTITDVEYRVDGGAWVSSGGITTFTISGLTNGVSYSVELRAITRFGASPASDTKSATPTAI